MSVQLDRQNFVMLYTNRDGDLLQVADSLLEVISVHTSSHGDNADYLITLTESRKNGYSRVFSIIYSDFIATKEEVMRQLNRNGFIFMPYYADIFRMYVTEELMRHIASNTLSYFHSGLGFTEMIDGSRQFLLGDSTYQGLPTIYRDSKAEFVHGDEAAYQSFLETEILPYKATRFALTLGLSSVLASDLQEYADINTLIMNLSGESSTGKTTIAQFMASLWGKPKISNRGIVRTFNSTDNSMIHSFTGIHGVSIVIDDATSDVHRDFSKFLYQASAGEDKLRMKSGSELQESNGNWSGTIIVTSEDDLLEFSTQTAGSIPRLLRLSGITWTKDASHSKSIKRFIMSHFGFVGRAFVEGYTALEHDEVVALYESYEQQIDERLTSRDQYTPRIVSKLAIIATTAAMIEQIFSYEHFKANEIVDMLVQLEKQTAVGRSLEHTALDIVKEFIVERQFTLPRKVKLQGVERIDGNHARDFLGYLSFKSTSVIEITLLSRVVRELLEKHGIQQWNTVLKRWKAMPFIKKYGQDSHVSETDNLLKVKAITFIFHKDEDSLLQWDFHSAPFPQRAPILNTNYQSDSDLDEIFVDTEE